MLQTTYKLNTLTATGWVRSETTELNVGDKITFRCNGRGRGGHFNVTAIVTKIKRKTIDCTEAERSYRPGTPWCVNKEDVTIMREAPTVFLPLEMSERAIKRRMETAWDLPGGFLDKINLDIPVREMK
jgi:hypothetical protein